MSRRPPRFVVSQPEPSSPHSSAARAAARLNHALALFEFGESIQREQLRRRHPDASPDEIERMLVAWLRDRPGAEHGDAAGRPIPWPRPSR
jgi:hypothetical protein